jgi:hypothetical protein
MIEHMTAYNCYQKHNYNIKLELTSNKYNNRHRSIDNRSRNKTSEEEKEKKRKAWMSSQKFRVLSYKVIKLKSNTVQHSLHHCVEHESSKNDLANQRSIKEERLAVTRLINVCPQQLRKQDQGRNCRCCIKDGSLSVEGTRIAKESNETNSSRGAERDCPISDE